LQKEKERIAQLEAGNAALRERVNQLEACLAELEGDWRKIAITAASPQPTIA